MRTRHHLPLVALLASGCMIFPRAGGRGVPVGLGEKPVASKEPPTSLIAVDGTRCLVTEEKFRNTAVGERVWCYWTQDGSQRATSATAGGRAGSPASTAAGGRGASSGNPPRIPRAVGGSRKPGA